MRNLNFLNQYRKARSGLYGNEYNGFFIIPITSSIAYQVIASNGCGWDHISVSLADFVEKKGYIPTWSEMNTISNLFFEPSEVSVEIFPKEEDYVNDTGYVLHLWRSTEKEMPIPDLRSLPQKSIEGEVLQTDANQFVKTNVFETSEWRVVSVEACNKFGWKLRRYPSWQEMCIVKDKWFDKDRAAIQIHSRDNNQMHQKTGENKYKLYICMPLTKELPLPDPFMVGRSRKYDKKKSFKN